MLKDLYLIGYVGIRFLRHYISCSFGLNSNLLSALLDVAPNL